MKKGNEMSYMKIDSNNCENFNDRRVLFNYGMVAEGPQTETGVVIGYRKTRFGVELIALKDETYEEAFISGFTDVGIGVYLIGER